MRKSWKWALCLGVVSLLLLGGCGKEKTEPVDLVLVTDGSELASMPCISQHGTVLRSMETRAV